MAEEKQSNSGSQLNLTVIALVSLVAIVSLVALVMNAAGVKTVATGSRIVEAQNVGGQAARHNIPVSEQDPDASGWCQNYADATKNCLKANDKECVEEERENYNSWDCVSVCGRQSAAETARYGCGGMIGRLP